FALAAPVDGLTVDFDGALSSFKVNGSTFAPSSSGEFFALPKDALRAGENVVELSYSHPYSVDGSGLYRFQDPEDERVYLYTNFEPYAAHRLFPCFDQPDLKGTFALTVDAPAAWTVVSTEREARVADAGSRREWTFKTTPRLSTYVFSVHAGPYHVWTSTAGAIPLRLFARESLARYVQADEWLDVTRRGLGFYGEYFNLPYPFEKYDQLIVPDFNEGAMENVGAVTFGERYVSRSTQTLEEREEAADTILHEMAHMWFGDLVTMKWWDGLWLNESFATYMAALSRSRATGYTRAWQTFFGDMKTWAYAEDQRETTHPIEAEVPDTGQAFANFDGITYGKGASVLKQLAFQLGEDKFRDGVRLYLKDHAYGNSEEKDFFGAMASASGADLSPWRKDWLDAAGVNTVRADYACGSGGKISAFALVQTAPAGQPALRRHRTRVGLFSEGPDGRLTETASAAAYYEGPRTELKDFAGRACPAFVYPNLGDEDYVKVELDPRSLETVKKGISRIPDPHLRQMLWATLWEMVRDAKWPVGAYADLVIANLVDETDFKTASAVLETVHGRHESSPSVLRYLEKPDYPRFEAFFLAGLAKAAPGSDLQKLWFDGYVQAAASPAGVERLQDYLSGTLRVEGLPLDQDRRWDVIERLSELDASGVDGLIESEARRDPADSGAKAAITARAARPDPETKKVWFARIVDPKSASSLGELRAAMEGFFPRTQASLRAEFLSPFLETLPALAAAKTDDFLDAYGRAMVPALCTPQGNAALTEFLEKTPPSKPVVLRALRDARQEDERCVKVRALQAQ
ncbi:MAG TPA: aminopeptidase N, partial [Elusimicrobiota bacterium]|nr:aminopeptidase N [Elusimicrobiota bacterium]